MLSHMTMDDAVQVLEDLEDKQTVEHPNCVIYKGFHRDHGHIYIVFLPIGDAAILPFASR